MVHGGLRYISHGDIRLTSESLRERERLLREAPGLIERMGYYFTLRKKVSFPAGFPLASCCGCTTAWRVSRTIDISTGQLRCKHHFPASTVDG